MKNRILSVFCAIAMLATMMSAFVVTASAADVPAITLTVLKQATAEEPAEVQVGYEGLPEGSVIKGIEIIIPIDESKFTFVDGSATGGLKYVARDKAVKRAWAATQEEDYKTETSAIIGKFELALAEGVEGGSTYILATDPGTQFTLATGDVKMSGSVELSTGEKKAPAKPEDPTLPETAYVYTKVLAQPAEEGAEVEIEVSYANLPENSVTKGIEIVIPIDETKYTFVDGSATGGLKYVARDKAVKRAWAATQEEDYKTETSAIVGKFKIKLADTVAWGDTVTIASSNDTQFTLATGDLKMTAVPGTIVVGSGAVVSKDLAVKLDKTAVTVEPGASAEVTATLENVKNTATITAESDNKDVTVSVKGTKITVTAAKKAADGTANVTVTAKEGDATATAKLVVTVKAKPVEKPAFKTDAETKEETIAGSKVNTFEAKIAPAEGKTAEEISALITGSEYQVIFDGKTDDGYAAGWAIVTISGDALKDALAGDGKLTDVKISIGGADKVAVSILDAEGNTVVLPE